MTTALAPRRAPVDMLQAPALPAAVRGTPVPRTALLVAPFYPKDPRTSFGKHVLTPALTLSALCGATPENWQVRVWDENLLQGPVPVNDVPQVVGITVHLTFARRAYALAAWFRARGSIVVLGGLHALACADEMQIHADAVAVGNGAITWPKILHDVDEGTLRPRYLGAYTCYDDEPLPDRSKLPPWAFLTPLSLVASRGCHHRCDFCLLSTGPRQKYQTLAIDKVVQQFVDGKHPYGVFIDNNLGSKKSYLRALCQALEPLGVIWSAAVSLDVSDDEELVREMAMSGCTGVFIGFESLDDDNLARAGKKSPRADDYARRIALFQGYGIQVNGSFVLGFDHDGPEVFDRLAAWVDAVGLECATYHILTPYPGTPLFERLAAEGRLLHRDWDLYDTGHCVFQPARMTPEQLEAGYARLYRKTFSLASIWRRRPAQLSALPTYLGMSFLYKKANWLWPRLIRQRLVHRVWAPLVELSRRRHLRFRKQLAADLGARRSRPVALFEATT
ncbi:MAG: radical SAM protein [Pseudomonadota bacterium]